MSFPSQPRRGVDISDIITGLGMLGNVLALPRSVEAQQVENEQTRALLTGSGIPEEQIKAATPEPMLRWLSPKQGGFTGKVLGGVGDVGAILSTVVGKPVKAPRMDLADIAAASRLRSESAKAAAQRHLEEVIANPKSTNREIGAAAVAAGSVEGGVRMMRGMDKPPGSLFAARMRLRDMAPDDPERPGLQKFVDDEDARQRRLADEAAERIEKRQPPHYDPAQQEHMRHTQLMADRKADALQRGLKEGTPEFDYFMSYGHPRTERAPKAEPTLDDYIENERRRRANAATKPGYKEPDESIQDTARRNMDADLAAKKAQKEGQPIVRPQPRGAPSVTVTPSSPPGTKPPGQGGEGPPSTAAGAVDPTSDAAAIEYMRGIDFDALPPEIQQQVRAARDAGMQPWPLANWLRSLQPAQPAR